MRGVKYQHTYLCHVEGAGAVGATEVAIAWLNITPPSAVAAQVISVLAGIGTDIYCLPPRSVEILCPVAVSLFPRSVEARCPRGCVSHGNAQFSQNASANCVEEL